MQKLYCYVDESGQDTRGEVFIVSVVVVGKERDELLALCERIEKQTGKGNHKWRTSYYPRRIAYLRAIFESKHFKGVLRYSISGGSQKYDLLTVQAIEKAIRLEERKKFPKIIVYVDALTKKKRQWYTKQLTAMGIQNKKIRGIRKDETDALIRLADAVAGLLRDALANKYPQAIEMMKLGKRTGMLIEV